ncbi:MAG: CAP domain-containing protein [Methanobacteriota archaeon]
MKIRSGSLLILLSIILIFFCPVLADSNETTFDLAFTALDCAPSGGPGSPLYTWFSLENKGTQISMTDSVIIYLSSDQNISISDYPIGDTKVSFIRPGTEIQKGLICTIPKNIPAGKYYAGAVLNVKFGVVKDAHEEDNTVIGNMVTINSSSLIPQEWYNTRISDLSLNYTNQERIKRNLNELNRNPELDVIALEMSRDMATRQFFDHINPSNEDPIDRAKRHGFNQLRLLPNGQQFYGIGENIVKIPVGTVYRFGDINPIDPDQIAKVAIQSFMNSPPHKSTLLLPEFESIGIGTSFDGENYYITQNFF